MPKFDHLELDFDSGESTKPKKSGSVIDSALEAIKAEGLNKLRCSLTGAPYATLEDTEIRQSLLAYTGTRIGERITVDELLDDWHLKALSLNSGMSPTLRNANSMSLSTLLMYDDGNARVITYCLSRFFYPPRMRGKGIYISSSDAVERMQFAAMVYDALAPIAKNDPDAWTVIQHLTCCDSYTSLSSWQRMTAFSSAQNRHSIRAKANADVRAWVDSPMDFEPTLDNIRRLGRFLMSLLCEVAGKGLSVPSTGDRLARSVFEAQAETIPNHLFKERAPGSDAKPNAITKKRTAGSNESEIPEWYRTLDKAAQTRFAWSATYGEGTPMRGDAPASRKKGKAAAPKSKPARKPKEQKLSKKAQRFMSLSSGNDDLEI